MLNAHKKEMERKIDNSVHSYDQWYIVLRHMYNKN